MARNDKIFVVMKKGRDEHWYWHAQHKANHKIMADSGQGYKSKRSCVNCVRTIFHEGVDLYEAVLQKDGSMGRKQIPND